jgi:hypothetical protein
MLPSVLKKLNFGIISNDPGALGLEKAPKAPSAPHRSKKEARSRTPPTIQFSIQKFPFKIEFHTAIDQPPSSVTDFEPLLVHNFSLLLWFVPDWQGG